MDRRHFLALGGATLGAAFLDGCGLDRAPQAQPALRSAERRNEAIERSLFRHRSVDRPPAGARAAGAAFPMYFISKHPPIWDESVRGAWTLEVSGAVKRPITLTLPELVKLPSITQRVDHFCVEGWTAVAEWTGVRMRELARIVEPTPDAGYVDFQSFDDDYHESWDIESAMHPQTIVAYGMDGRYLGVPHGAPARLHSPVKLGYKNTKYLTRIVFLPARNGGYWSDQGYEWYGGV